MNDRMKAYNYIFLNAISVH